MVVFLFRRWPAGDYLLWLPINVATYKQVATHQAAYQPNSIPP